MIGTYVKPLKSQVPLSIQRLQHELNNSLVEFRNGLMASQGALSMNVWQKEREWIIRIELPGAELENISIDVQDDRVKISAERQQSESDEGTVLKSERPFGRLNRELELPFKIDASQTAAVYERGILELKIVGLEEEGPQRIEVQSR
ncbi:Hsp20/alpha crystallin family protein [Rubinisphaera italica]|uniref:18 kDa heat shock protein n=1 Tax=Rubinisphaera italica TaxID=2527969 RepID=A0A5C5XQD0_9PLAN|nr:Hsp20/alpha crystallin family protein [Rubinisphaera italica]TWT64275.1 18 kDa heat shock protein [Rubinisphaera italica]